MKSRRLDRRTFVVVLCSTALLMCAYGLGSVVRVPSSSAAAGPPPSTEITSPLPVKFEPENAPTPALSNFPTNSAGLTYGSDSAARSLADSPDLVAVVGDSGVFGYVRKQDLNGLRISSPQDAVSRQRSQGSHSVVIPVFDVEGIDEVDTFTMSP